MCLSLWSTVGGCFLADEWFRVGALVQFLPVGYLAARRAIQFVPVDIDCTPHSSSDQSMNAVARASSWHPLWRRKASGWVRERPRNRVSASEEGVRLYNDLVCVALG